MNCDISSSNPGYLELYRSGELKKRAEQLESLLKNCAVCPRDCGINRLEGETGFCHSGYNPVVSSVVAHHGEEPVFSGTRGSGTIFFGNCNLRCAYCQNFQISQSPETQQHNEISIGELAEKMLFVQNELNCHNVNLVSPSHFVPQIVKALLKAVPKGLHLPIIYNTGSYDSVETIRLLDGIISIYLPDLKYADNSLAVSYSSAPDYVTHARAAIKEMYRQVGDLETDIDDIAVKGMVVRHLVLPNDIAGSIESLEWLASEISPTVTVGIMSQYHPVERVRTVPEIARPITIEEYDEVVRTAERLGLENGWIQEMDSKDHYLPDFDRETDPFNR